MQFHASLCAACSQILLWDRMQMSFMVQPKPARPEAHVLGLKNKTMEQHLFAGQGA